MREMSVSLYVVKRVLQVFVRKEFWSRLFILGVHLNLGRPTHPTHYRQCYYHSLYLRDKRYSKENPAKALSIAWLHFKRKKGKVICNYRGKEYTSNSSSHGTTNMLKHFKICSKSPYKENDKKKQKMLALGRESRDILIVLISNLLNLIKSGILKRW